MLFARRVRILCAPAMRESVYVRMCCMYAKRARDGGRTRKYLLRCVAFAWLACVRILSTRSFRSEPKHTQTKLHIHKQRDRLAQNSLAKNPPHRSTEKTAFGIYIRLYTHPFDRSTHKRERYTGKRTRAYPLVECV